MGQFPDMTGAFIMFGLMCAIAGWALIEGLIWVFSHIRVVLA
ncbi:hypothetical protein [Pseudomonas sp. NY15374]